MLMISRRVFFFLSETVVRIKTWSQILVSLATLLGEIPFQFTIMLLYFIFMSKEFVINLTFSYCTVFLFVISKTVILPLCKSWCIVKVLTIDSSTLFMLLYFCCSFFPILKIIIQTTDSSSFNCVITNNHWHIFIFMWVEALVSTEENMPFSLSHWLYVWKKLLHCGLNTAFLLQRCIILLWKKFRKQNCFKLLSWNDNVQFFLLKQSSYIFLWSYIS